MQPENEGLQLTTGFAPGGIVAGKLTFKMDNLMRRNRIYHKIWDRFQQLGDIHISNNENWVKFNEGISMGKKTSVTVFTAR